MKKLFAFALMVALSSVTLESCTSTKGTAGVASSTGMIGNIVNSLVSVLGTIPALQGTMGKISAVTSLSSILTNPMAVSAFKGLLSSKYQIPVDKVNSAYGSMNTVQDVAGFIGKNANPSVLNSFK